jgi:hypothetical protein
MIFDRLEKEIDHVDHQIVLFPVPFSFIRVRIAETIFEHLKNLPNRLRHVPLIKQTNSIFNLPELYDDLLDEWTHRAHIQERNDALLRLQHISQTKKLRITFFSGDVHCCGISRFRTHGSHRPLPIDDHRLMYQMISSAIVNMPPSQMAIRMAHRFQTKWKPVDETEEEMIDFFQRRPEDGGKAFHKKFRPNRNWCYFEQCDNPLPANVIVVQPDSFLPSALGPTSTEDGQGSEQAPIHRHSYGRFCHARILNDQRQVGSHDLRIRLWLESARKHRDKRQFVAYDLLIPSLQ